MSNTTAGRKDGKTETLARIAALALLLTAFPPSRLPALQAQVGYDPSHSPFRDISTRQEMGLVVGHFFGNTAKAGVGAQAANTFGVRFRTRLSGPLDLNVNATHIGSKRLFIDPTKPDSVRRVGNVDFALISFEVGLSLGITGAKTWHGLAPWVGVNLGFIAPTAPKTDPGGYKASSGFTISPAIGTALYVSPRLSLQFEARDNTIRYEWPLAYFQPTDPSTGAPLPPAVLPLSERDKQLTHNFSLSVGLSYHFNF
jgi:hypothetical protein